MNRLNRIFSLLLALSVSVFFMACEAETQEDEGELGAESEAMEGTTPVEPGPMAGADTETFASWDTDADAGLTEDEFRTGLEQGNWWTEWDTDANANLNEEEFNTAFGDYQWYEEGLFGEWDADGNGELTEEEWEAGLFGTWDENGDDLVQEDEYDGGIFS